MDENKNKVEEKKEVEIVAGKNPYDNIHSIVSNIGFTRSSEIKYEVYAFRPLVTDGIETVEAQLKEHYDIDLQGAVDQAIKKMLGAPGFKTAFQSDKDKPNFGTLLKGGHEKMQAMMDSYRVGQRATDGLTQKKRIEEHKALQASAEALGMTVAELIAMAQDLKGSQD